MKKFKYDYILYIGRFEPPHRAHVEIIKQALTQSQHVIVLIGSAYQPRTIKNPLTWQERENMIRSSVTPKEDNRLICLPLQDKTYNDAAWTEQVQSLVSKQTENTGRIAITGHSKDKTSYYLNMFPQWDFIEVQKIDELHSTEIRQQMFELEQVDKNNVSEGVYDYLKAFMNSNAFSILKDEYFFIQKYKQAWAKAPYPPTFVTVDAVVVQSGHVLLVRRKSEPGKNLWAICGGFVDHKEHLEEAALRELKEETKIKVPVPVLRGNIKFKFVADAPNRSLRGRTISHVFGIELPPGPLPKISKAGGDDAAQARWIPLNVFSMMEDQMFEDHYHLINKVVENLG